MTTQPRSIQRLGDLLKSVNSTAIDNDPNQSPGEFVQQLCQEAAARLEEFADFARRYAILSQAARQLYFAARWTPDRDVGNSDLWGKLRDAAGLPPGSASSRGIGSPPADEDHVNMMRNRDEMRPD